MSARSLNNREMRRELIRQIDEAAGMREWCRRKGLSHTVVSLAVNAHRPIPEAVANACGFIVETTFKPVRAAVPAISPTTIIERAM